MKFTKYITSHRTFTVGALLTTADSHAVARQQLEGVAVVKGWSREWSMRLPESAEEVGSWARWARGSSSRGR